MLADPRHSCVVLLNITRGRGVDAHASVLGVERRLALLSACREVFGILSIGVRLGL
jgi:hypothetical protein